MRVGSAVERGGLFGEAVEFFLDHAAVEIVGNEHDPRAPVVIRPFGEFRRVMKHVLHAMNGNRPVASRDVENTLDPQQFLAVLADQNTHKCDKGFPVNRLVAGNAERGDRFVVPVNVMAVIMVVVVVVVVVMAMSVIVTMVVFHIGFVAEPALNIDRFRFRIVQPGIEQLIG